MCIRDRYKKEYGQKCFQVAKALNLIAELNQEQGHLKEAEKTYQEILQIGEEIQDETIIQGALTKLGQFYMLTSEYQKSCSFQEKSLLKSRQKTDDLPESALLVSLQSLALVQCRLNKFEEAEKNLKEAENISMEIAGKDSAFAARLREAYGEYYFLVGRYKDAKTNFEEALSILGQKPLLKFKWAFNEICLGNLEEGYAKALESFEAVKWKMYENSLDQANFAVAYCTYFQWKGRLKENKEMIEKIENIFKVRMGWIKNHYLKLMYQYFLVVVIESDDLEQCVILAEATLEAAKQLYGSDSPHICLFLNKLTELYLKVSLNPEELEEAEEKSNLAITILEKHKTFENSVLLAEAYLLAGKILKGKGSDAAQAQQYLTKAKQIYQSQLSPKHPKLLSLEKK
eukprot:TRINITY_DN4249_c0_g1_i1.p1 TRINITY_DN4249_c0_g1~~TRINITY_DN4249_c0_g1_i1.p1  ORF type:complete len:401 (+),score=33.86 TRINITY_DN4249_c0_g1_i1:63-1265(+)